VWKREGGEGRERERGGEKRSKEEKRGREKICELRSQCSALGALLSEDLRDDEDVWSGICTARKNRRMWGEEGTRLNEVKKEKKKTQRQKEKKERRQEGRKEGRKGGREIHTHTYIYTFIFVQQPSKQFNARS
jgi:hypothetical protein